MDIKKSHWESHNGQVSLSLAISKIDQERRIVSGFATLNNLDRQDDIVLASASKEAFGSFLGNVREMHDKIAAGRVVSFSEKSYFDPVEEKIYDGIYVDVYVSKGAESTWEKVLDGTLSGFSIGGSVIDQETIWDETVGKFVNIIKKYVLTELSLVDSPANQFASVLAVLKSSDGKDKVSGIAVGVETVDVFWCSDDNIATIGNSACMDCGKTVEKAGWIESNLSDTEKSQAIAGLLKNTAKPAVEKEEGVKDIMAEETTVEKAAVVDEAAAVEETVETVVTEKSDTVDEATAEAEVSGEADESAAQEIDWQAELASLRETVNGIANGITEAFAGITKNLESTTERVDEISKGMEAFSAEIKESLAKTETAATEVAERVSGVEKSLVTKKASDRALEKSVATEKKDIWSDRFTVPTN